MWLFINQIKTAFPPLMASLIGPPCLLCGSMQASTDNYCPACYQDLPHNLYCCSVCALPLHQAVNPNLSQNSICGQCLKHPPAFNQSHAAFHYLPPITSFIHAFKDRNNQVAGRLLGACLCRYLKEHIDGLPDLIIPMPLHKQRLRERGFNQAKVIAQLLCKRLDVPYSDKLIHRQLHTPSQQGLNQKQRQKNLRQAFAVATSSKVKAELKGIKHVAIVDDVFTTGASANALAKCLRQASEDELFIEIWCVARTLPPHSKLHLY
jgi:ComF family protein